jgi:hypothetical protein
VRFAARKYLEHVALRRLPFGELEPQFLRNYFLPRLASLATSKTSIAARCKLLDDILNAADRRFSRIDEDLVSTKANLNYEVLADICLVCSIPTKYFEGRSTFIDIILLKRRNAIAHGEDAFVAFEDLDYVTGETVAIMRAFGDALENHVILKTYKAA